MIKIPDIILKTDDNQIESLETVSINKQNNPINNTFEAMQLVFDEYFNGDNNFPWILGFSGGKDSSFLLQIVIEAILKGRNMGLELKRKVHIICSDTKVENPILEKRNEKIDVLLNNWIEREGLECLKFKLVKADPSDSFWVNLIGRGYPAPNQTFRWCTHRLKIQPMMSYINNLKEEFTKVVTILGVRYSESKKREGSIKKFEINEWYSRSEVDSRSLIFTPIKKITLIEVWKYLLYNNPPWDRKGTLNKELEQLYQESSLGGDTGYEKCGFSITGGGYKRVVVVLGEDVEPVQ